MTTKSIKDALRTMTAPAAMALALLVAPGLDPSARAQSVPESKYSSDDPLMNAAIRCARSRLDLFWVHLTDPLPGEDDFRVKVVISDGVANRHFWCGNVGMGDSGLNCAIANRPLPRDKAKSDNMIITVIILDVDNIVDWMWRRNGKIVGGETTRLLIGMLPHDATAGAKRAMFSDVDPAKEERFEGRVPARSTCRWPTSKGN